jgi:peptidoglycan-associated lipoprotein
MSIKLFSKGSRAIFPIVVASFVLAGCVTAPDQTGSPGSGASGSASAGGAKGPVAAPSKAQSSVYFEFDRFDVKPDGQAVAAAYANYMKSDSRVRVTIEGNADERGTVEYNLALGQKRAEAVRRELIQRGVAAGRVEAISNGEEKPIAKGSNEEAWAKNRRADVIVK